MTGKSKLALTVNAQVSASRLDVEVGVQSERDGEVYIFNKLWRSKKGAFVWDERGVYRYQVGGALRLLYGPAPVPPNTSVATRYIPFATKLAPGGAATLRAELALPVEELTLFQPPPPDAETEPVEVERLSVVVFWAEPGPKVKVDPSPIDKELYFWVKAPDQLMFPVAAEVEIPKITVIRRKDPLTRLLLPGEEEP